MIERVHFQSFKSLANVTLELGRLTALVGANGCGKSSVLRSRSRERAGATGEGEEDGEDEPMLSFHEMLTEANQAQATAGEPPKAPPTTRWDQILDEFCTWLNEHYSAFLGASLHDSWGDSAAPRVRTLRLWPRGQRNVQRTVLALQTTEKTARVLGVETVEIEEEEGLKKWLIAFSLRPRFRETLEALEELTSRPVEGVLRANAERKAKGLMSDVIVAIPPDQQRRLADASEATLVERIDRLYVTPVNPPLWERYTADTKPIWLIAGGYALEIDPGSDALEPDGRVRLSGKPVPASALD